MQSMITYNRIKTNILATFFGLLLGISYLYFYINGYFGQAIFGWDFLSGLLISFIHPVAIIGLIPFLIIVYVSRRKNFNTKIDSIQKVTKINFYIILVSTVLIVSLFMVEKEIALVYAFIYFFIIGFFSSYLLGMRLFEFKESN
jgi:cobalamin biosynthesis protein CobD/CbiB